MRNSPVWHDPRSWPQPTTGGARSTRSAATHRSGPIHPVGRTSPVWPDPRGRPHLTGLARSTRSTTT